MYQDRLAVAIKSNGKVLREFKDTVYLPFGSEYSILIKNLHARRALINVWIDGVNVSEGHALVVGANESFDLERFIKNANLEEGNRFKFIERTKKIEDGPRGIKIEDGLIRVEFEFEREAIPIKSFYASPALPGWPGATPFRGAFGNSFSSASASASASESTHSVMDSCVVASPAAAPVEQSYNDAGITVPGSKSTQQFHVVQSFATDGVKHVMVLKLLGETETGAQVSAPVTVKTKQKCVTCGHVNKATSKFCSECGTALEIL